MFLARWMNRPVSVLGATVLAFALALPAQGEVLPTGGGTFHRGDAAYRRGDFPAAARLLFPIARRGNARAQAMVGFMFATGQGLPQSYNAAAYWYELSASQGNVTAQYLLGLAYDKGQGVPLDPVAAYMWLNLAVAGAPKRDRENLKRLRDAAASKMTQGQLAEGQARALEWGHPPARPRP